MPGERCPEGLPEEATYWRTHSELGVAHARPREQHVKCPEAQGAQRIRESGEVQLGPRGQETGARWSWREGHLMAFWGKLKPLRRLEQESSMARFTVHALLRDRNASSEVSWETWHFKNCLQFLDNPPIEGWCLLSPLGCRWASYASTREYSTDV